MLFVTSCVHVPHSNSNTSAMTDQQPSEPIRFGLLTDVQYADKETAGKRRYREALVNLEQCVLDLKTRDLDFVVHCGDIIDGRELAAETNQDLTRVLDIFSELNVPVHHVIGNHCLEVPRTQLLERLGLKRSYSSFALGGWRFIIVDALAFSVCGLPADSPELAANTQWLENHRGTERSSLNPWNGGLGETQRAWLQQELALAADAKQHAVVFSHLPVLAASSTDRHLLWDHEEVLAILDAAPAFAAWVNGHDHAGGFAERNQRSFLTLPAMVNAAPENNAYAVVEAYPDRLEIAGVGNVKSRTIYAPQ